MNLRAGGWIGIALICSLAFAMALWLVVDQDLMIRQSENFTRGAFAEVKEGMTLSEAVAILGAPVKSERLDPMTRLNPTSDALHYFSAPATDWWPVYTQVWVVTDPDEVITVVAITDEP